MPQIRLVAAEVARFEGEDGEEVVMYRNGTRHVSEKWWAVQAQEFRAVFSEGVPDAPVEVSAQDLEDSAIKKANVDASNIQVDAWIQALGIGGAAAKGEGAFDPSGTGEQAAANATKFAVERENHVGRQAASTISDFGIEARRAFHMEDALLAFRTALACRNDSRIDIVVIGDFSTQPQWAESVADRLNNLLGKSTEVHVWSFDVGGFASPTDTKSLAIDIGNINPALLVMTVGARNLQANESPSQVSINTNSIVSDIQDNTNVSVLLLVEVEGYVDALVNLAASSGWVVAERVLRDDRMIDDGHLTMAGHNFVSDLVMRSLGFHALSGL